MKKNSPRGFYLIPSYENLRFFYGVIFLNVGLYKGGIFKFQISLPSNYPSDDAYPNIKFSSPIHNPYIDFSSGKFNLIKLIPKWIAAEHQLVTVAKFIHQIFFLEDNSMTSLSNQAVSSIIQISEDFKRKIKYCVQLSQDQKFSSNSDDLLIFSETNSQIECLKQNILQKN